jgi:hypothetical protein
MENKFKYRPEVKSIEDLQPGDEFLVGEQKWYWDGQLLGINGSKNDVWGGGLTLDLIRANVPIERDIPYPEGGAEQWELREGDGEWIERAGYKYLHHGSWFNAVEGVRTATHLVYAIPKAKRVEFECNGSDFFQRYLPTSHYEDIISGKWGRIKVTLEPAEGSAHGTEARDTDQPGGKDK